MSDANNKEVGLYISNNKNEEKTNNQNNLNEKPKCSKKKYSKNETSNYFPSKNSHKKRKYTLEYNGNCFYPKGYKKRGESKESSNESTSIEETANASVHKETTPYHSDQKRKQPFKSRAADFKVKYKTELCKYFEIYGYCQYGENCAYAHGKENLRSKITNSTAYRTRKCEQFFKFGYCPYGNRCQFAHGLKSNIINNPYDRKMSYTKTLEILGNLENAENIKLLFDKPRLKVFRDIVENIEGSKSRILDDFKQLKQHGFSYLF